MMDRTSRFKDALGYATLSAFCFAALSSSSLGACGVWAAHALRVACGAAAWVIPVWLGDAARRAYLGERRDVLRALVMAFHVATLCVTVELAQVGGGWVGARVTSMLLETIGLAAYAIVCGIWFVGALRLLGPQRVEQFAGHASALSRRAVEQCRPMRQLPSPDQTLRAEVVDASAYSSVALSPVRHAARDLDPVRPASPPLPSAPAKPRAPSKWSFPETTLLRPPQVRRIDEKFLTDVAHDLFHRLSSYGINATVEPSSVQGALVSRYEVLPNVGQQVGPIKSKQADLESAYEGLRFVDMPGTGRVGIEIPLPKAQREVIAMRKVLDSAAWAESDAVLPLALGVTAAGDPVIIDLATCPHLLVAGATGSGKSVGLNVMMTSLLLTNSPAEVQIILIDAKIVEFAQYRGLPHLHCAPVTEIQTAIEKLQWAVEEMDSRYMRFADAGVKDVDSFNSESGQRLPRIVIVIDEYADLTSISKQQAQVVEGCVCRLAQKARGAGIHLILATQRPSVDVITGVIKANFPSRIAYKVSQAEDSKTILGQPGAQFLIGDGDSLCLIPKLSIKVTRVHGAFIDAAEVRAVCNAWKAQTDPSQPSPIPAKLSTSATPRVDEPSADAGAECAEALAVTPPSGADSEVDHEKGQPNELYDRAVAYAREKKLVSARQLGVELRCGFERAKKLFERMKDEGLVKAGGPNNTHVFVETN